MICVYERYGRPVIRWGRELGERARGSIGAQGGPTMSTVMDATFF